MQAYSIFIGMAMSFLLLACGRPEAVNTMEEIKSENEEVNLFSPKKADSSLYGVYRGILPCKDCGSVQYKLTLFEDNSYEMLELSQADLKEVKRYKGKFNYEAENNRILIKQADLKLHFDVRPNQLFLLNEDGQAMQLEVSESPYLNKGDLKLGSAIWQLISLEGELISESLPEFAWLRFRPDGSMSYTGGCNQCRASYAIKIPQEIYIKGGACTKKMCSFKHYDEQMSRLLNQSTQFQIEGNELIFSDKGKELIRFESSF